MRKFAMSAVVGGAFLGLAACSATQVATDAPKITSVITEIQSVLNLGVIPQPASGIAALALTGLQGLINGEVAVAGAPTETQVLANLADVSSQVHANVPAGSAASTDAAQALVLIKQLQANETGTTKTQVEGAVGVMLSDYLSGHLPTSAAMGAAPSQAEGLLNKARSDSQTLQQG